MSESPHLQRALVLQSQGRHDLAEKELRQHLAEAPTHGFAHAVLALNLAEMDRLDEAQESAREAIGLAPDAAFSHYAMARVLSSRNREDEAAVAIQEAIRLEPTDADYHGMLAAIEFHRRRWQPSLDAAETGLQFDPEHVNCNNLRAMALVKLGRKAEAGATIDSTLSRDPDNAVSHANKGWTLLEQGKRKEAMGHFRESLRLDPTSDWARAGLVEAIKAGNPIYAVMLKYFLWMAKLSSRAQWGIVLGGYFGNRMLGELSRSNPSWSPWIDPIRVAYVAFALLTWLAHPIFNLMLFLHPQGRHALSQDQREQASWIGLILGLALASLGMWFYTEKKDRVHPHRTRARAARDSDDGCLRLFARLASQDDGGRHRRARRDRSFRGVRDALLGHLAKFLPRRSRDERAQFLFHRHLRHAIPRRLARDPAPAPVNKKAVRFPGRLW